MPNAGSAPFAHLISLFKAHFLALVSHPILRKTTGTLPGWRSHIVVLQHQRRNLGAAGDIAFPKYRRDMAAQGRFGHVENRTDIPVRMARDYLLCYLGFTRGQAEPRANPGQCLG
jgi:hypothetical protein